MAELPYPYFQMAVNGTDRTGALLTVHIAYQENGYLPGQDDAAIVDTIRQTLAAGQGVTSTSLTRSEVTSTSL